MLVTPFAVSVAMSRQAGHRPQGFGCLLAVCHCRFCHPTKFACKLSLGGLGCPPSSFVLFSQEDKRIGRMYIFRVGCLASLPVFFRLLEFFFFEALFKLAGGVESVFFLQTELEQVRHNTGLRHVFFSRDVLDFFSKRHRRLRMFFSP